MIIKMMMVDRDDDTAAAADDDDDAVDIKSNQYLKFLTCSVVHSRVSWLVSVVVLVVENHLSCQPS